MCAQSRDGSSAKRALLGILQGTCAVEEDSVYVVWSKCESQNPVCTWERHTSAWQLAPRLSFGPVLPNHVDVSSNQEENRESEWESSYGEDINYRITWEKLS